MTRIIHAGMTSTANFPVVLFGAFDRHNFGDMLFPHIVSTLLPEEDLIFAGLVQRDLRPFGGHLVHALSEVVRQTDRPLKLIHVGGELLGCDAWEAAVMVSGPDEAEAAIRQSDHRPVERRQWASQTLAMSDSAPYVVSRTALPKNSELHFHAVGGVEFGAKENSHKEEVIAKLKAATSVTVRDGVTQSILASEGVPACLIPDPAVMVSRLFGEKIQAAGDATEVSEVRRRYPQGYVAVQCSADFGDDASIDLLAAQLDQLCREWNFGCVFFRAGAAPWHDDLGCYQRIARRMPDAATHVFQSLDLWEICALIASSRLVCGSSLHARILAMAYGLPRLTFKHRTAFAENNALEKTINDVVNDVVDGAANKVTSKETKHSAYLSAWELPALQAVVPLARIADATAFVLQVDRRLLTDHANRLADTYACTSSRLKLPSGK